ncbi:histidine phosphatase family protein [Specibacter cremeus]|uniref:histidine phosphatase family protein n=1 Tax=Specibacter cremeus TaxID=1629051 RepID=UPI001F0BB2F5|nr:histidine phosphatase family protein [Specibacter cremeus]
MTVASPLSEQPAGLRRRVVFWRHGQTDWNAAGRFQGQTDIPLNDVGARQAARAARLLAGHLADHHGRHTDRPGAWAGHVRIMSSDLRRARDTAGALAGLTGQHVYEDARLRETNGGAWEGLSFTELQERYPAGVRLWQRDDPTSRAGGGETRVEVAGRMIEAVSEAVAALPAGGSLVVATHGGSSRVGLAQLLGLPAPLWRSLSGLSNCHWSVVEEIEPVLDGSVAWRLLEHNVGTLPDPYELPEELAETPGG